MYSTGITLILGIFAVTYDGMRMRMRHYVTSKQESSNSNAVYLGYLSILMQNPCVEPL